jgi:periplasmic copper chaperone A
MKAKKVVLLIGLIVFQFLNADSTNKIKIEDAMIRLVPATSPNTGAFMVIKNDSKENIFLTKAESDISKSVELHNMILIEGIMQMRPIEKIEIKANSSVSLKPGSFHIMFIGLNQSLKKEDKKTVVLYFSNGQKEKVLIPVKEMIPTK